MTPELAALRRGKLTASVAAIVMGKMNTDGLATLVRRLAGERLYGDLGEDSYQSWQMKRGTETENDALAWFEFEHSIALEHGPHVDHPTIPNVAATPDGLRRREFNVEAKCPTWHVYCETVAAWSEGYRGLDAIPSAYRWQCRWQTWTCDVPEGRFVVYHPARGGIVVPYTITQEDRDAMASRVVTVEALIRNWIEILKGE